MEFDEKESRLLSLIVDRIATELPNILSIYVFGSFGTKYETKESDIDIAVLPAQKLDRVALWNLAQKIAVEVGRDVEIVDLLEASTVFRYQVLTTGTRLYCRDERECDVIELSYISMYLRFNEERAAILEDYGSHG